ARPVRRRAELSARDVLTGHTVHGEEVAVPRGGGNEFSRAAVDRAVDEHGRLRRVPVVHVAWRGLVVPGHLAGVDVHRDERARKKSDTCASARHRVRGRWIAGAEYVEACLWIVDARHPRLTAAVSR